MMASDIRYADPDARISTTFARLGLVAEYGVSWLLPRLIGVGHTLDLLLSGRTITGAEAASVGLVQRTVPAGCLVQAAIEYARELADKCSPASMAVIKQQVYEDLSTTSAEALSRSLSLMDESLDGADFAEAMAARAEDRSARFAALPAELLTPSGPPDPVDGLHRAG